MPGGAPLRKGRSTSKRPCKYGPRDADGLCPKKPRTARKSAAKKPCKYGPRDAQGRCPKKPFEERVKRFQTGGAQVKEAARVLRSEKATRTQKQEAVTAAAAALGVDAAKSAARATRTELRKQARTKAGRAAIKQIKTVVGGAAVGIGKRVIPVAIAGAVISKAAKGIVTLHRRDAERKTARELVATEKRLKRKLTPQERALLQKQYMEFFLKQPVHTPTIK